MAEVKVTIDSETLQLHGNDKSLTPDKASEKAVPKSKTAKESHKSSSALAVASMIGSQSLNYVTSNVGKWTGNSRNQQVVDNVKRAFVYGAALYVNPALALTTAALDFSFTMLESYENLANDRRRSYDMKVRAGTIKGMKR